MQAQEISQARNFPYPTASNPMSSLNGAKFEAHEHQALPTPGADGAEAGQPTDPAAGGDPSPINLASRRELDLLRKAQQGDRAAYGQLVVAYQDRLYNAVLRMVGDHEEARELTQETFTRGLMKLDSFRGDAGPYTWLFRIAVNLSISHLRKVQRHRVFSLDAPSRNGNGRTGGSAGSDDQASSLAERISRDGLRRGRDPSSDLPPEDLERHERHAMVLAALGRLDAEYRAVLVMRDIEGFDYQQMADVLGLPLGTLKSRLFRARLALRDELRPYLTEQDVR